MFPIKRNLFIPLFAGLVLVVLTVTFASAQDQQPPRESLSSEILDSSGFIPIQGRLMDSNGQPLNGTYTLTFRLYDAGSAEVAVCQDNTSTQVTDGFFNTYMYAASCPFDGRQLLLGIEVNSDGEMTPRQFVDNVPYAMSLRPGAIISASMSSNAVLHIENWAATGRAFRAYAMSQTGTNYGIVGASRSPDGYGGYFYNNGGGVGLLASSDDGLGLSAQSVNGTGLTATSDNGIGLTADSTNGDGLWGTSVNGAGVHGSSYMGAGVEGYGLLGPGVYGESLSGVAIAANGVITSSEKTYLWISGNDVRPFNHGDSTYMDFNSRGGARIFRGAVDSLKNVVLPITIPGTLYGQNVKLTAIELFWKGDTATDSILTIRLRRQTGVCDSCFAEILADLTDHLCWEGDFAQGCTIQRNLTTNNVLSSQSGILYLTMELSFSGATWIDFDGARLTLEYDN